MTSNGFWNKHFPTWPFKVYFTQTTHVFFWNESESVYFFKSDKKHSGNLTLAGWNGWTRIESMYFLLRMGIFQLRVGTLRSLSSEESQGVVNRRFGRIFFWGNMPPYPPIWRYAGQISSTFPCHMGSMYGILMYIIHESLIFMGFYW